MGVVGVTVLLSFLIGFVASYSDVPFNGLTTVDEDLPAYCRPNKTCRVEYILQKRKSNSGWKEHTHRANIALAVNYWFDETTDEVLKRQMDLQLDVEIAKALLRNNSVNIHANDLALYIHALIAKSKNPRNFHGIDLVADLLHRVETEPGEVHPFLVLALCNSYAEKVHHLEKLKIITEHHDIETREQIEMKALALKAFACGASRDQSLIKHFENETKAAVRCLVSKQEEDGRIGNAYTTSLAVQALIAYNGKEKWNKHGALDYLEKEACEEVNMIKAYYIEMALNAHRVTFIKNLYKGPVPPEPETPDLDTRHYVQYTIRTGEMPDIYHTITIKVEKNLSFFEVMQKCSENSENFRFEFYTNKQQSPVVYSVAGIPNDAEENMFWRLCEQSKVNHVVHSSQIVDYLKPPNQLIPGKDNHYIFWYRNKNCQGS